MRPVLITLFFIAVFLGILIGKSFLIFPELYQDENHYLPTARMFAERVIPSLELLKTYNQLNTPLPFLMGGWTLQLLGDSVQYLRLMNFLLAFGVVMIFVWYKPKETGKKIFCLIPLLAMPSFYLCAIHYYTDMVAWITALWGLTAYLNRRHLWAFLAFTLSIASRQYMLAFPLAIGLYEVIRIWEQNSWRVGDTLQKMLDNRVWLYYAVSVLSLVPWILLWGGLAPEAIMKEQHYDTGVFYNPGFVIYVSACAAFYYVIPEAIIRGDLGYYLSFPKRYSRLFLWIVLITIALVISFPPKQTYNPYFTWPYLGYVDQLLEYVGISGVLKNLIFGSLMVIALMRFINPDRLSLGSIILFINILLLGKAQLSWDKYLFPTLLVLWFLEYHGKDREIVLSGNK